MREVTNEKLNDEDLTNIIIHLTKQKLDYIVRTKRINELINEIVTENNGVTLGNAIALRNFYDLVIERDGVFERIKCAEDKILQVEKRLKSCE